VIQNPIDRYGEITDNDVTGGRFIILTSQRLDTLIFKQGRLVTFAGKLIGTRKQLLEGREYLYPLFAAEELHLWKPVRYYYAPYPYWYDPLYYPYYPYSSYWYGPPFLRPYNYPYW
jgi:outer membrane lipoprotein